MLLDQISIHSWINNNGIKTENGKTLDFHTHRYLYDIYRDHSPYIACLKAGQIGFSTMAIIKTIWLAKYRKINIGYLLPTLEMVQKFVGSKVNPIAQQNSAIQEMMRDKDTVYQKQVGSNFIHYLGSQTPTAAIMLSLDMLVGDEYDKCPPNILEMFDSRLQASDLGYKWVFSNPTAPDFGADKYFKMSDQKKWHVTHQCLFEFILDESCINYEKEIYECPHCHGEISDEERRLGEWKATTVSKYGWSGYWIPLWLSPKVGAKRIAEYKRTKSAEYFANFVAGLPFVGGGNKVAPSTIVQCISPKVNDQEDRIIIGVDTGLPIHYVLANKQGYFFYGKCGDPTKGADPYKELEGLLKRFPNSILVSDQGGDLIGIRRLQSDYPGRVFLCWYRKDKKSQEIIRWGDDANYGEVYADRNQLIQLFIDEMMKKLVTFNGNESEWQDYIVHWMNIYRKWETDDAGMVDKFKGFTWERTGPDHWVHATMYARIGLSKYIETMAQVVGGSIFDDLSIGRIFDQ